ncbi:Protein of unknown function [Pyronema omphalodes CBS 100304]|uniref:Uncharacterized protein n=1 Tax=Pyronema omphalodes (strain CBS 100304) TaxID=1076935 RepID=U4L6U7_PYROM|nr:Protein of unknown function [Pyronema omphalodes CBS 100304]
MARSSSPPGAADSFSPSDHHPAPTFHTPSRRDRRVSLPALPSPFTPVSSLPPLLPELRFADSPLWATPTHNSPSDSSSSVDSGHATLQSFLAGIDLDGVSTPILAEYQTSNSRTAQTTVQKRSQRPNISAIPPVSPSSRRRQIVAEMSPPLGFKSSKDRKQGRTMSISSPIISGPTSDMPAFDSTPKAPADGQARPDPSPPFRVSTAGLPLPGSSKSLSVSLSPLGPSLPVGKDHGASKFVAGVKTGMKKALGIDKDGDRKASEDRKASGDRKEFVIQHLGIQTEVQQVAMQQMRMMQQARPKIQTISLEEAQRKEREKNSMGTASPVSLASPITPTAAVSQKSPIELSAQPTLPGKYTEQKKAARYGDDGHRVLSKASQAADFKASATLPEHVRKASDKSLPTATIRSLSDFDSINPDNAKFIADAKETSAALNRKFSMHAPAGDEGDSSSDTAEGTVDVDGAGASSTKKNKKKKKKKKSKNKGKGKAVSSSPIPECDGTSITESIYQDVAPSNEELIEQARDLGVFLDEDNAINPAMVDEPKEEDIEHKLGNAPEYFRALDKAGIWTKILSKCRILAVCNFTLACKFTQHLGEEYLYHFIFLRPTNTVYSFHHLSRIAKKLVRTSANNRKFAYTKTISITPGWRPCAAPQLYDHSRHDNLYRGKRLETGNQEAKKLEQEATDDNALSLRIIAVLFGGIIRQCKNIERLFWNAPIPLGSLINSAKLHLCTKLTTVHLNLQDHAITKGQPASYFPELSKWSGCRTLTHLTLYNMSSLWKEAQMMVSGLCKNLQWLELGIDPSCPRVNFIFDEVDGKVSFNKLKMLHLKGFVLRGNAIVSHIPSPTLTQFCLTRCSGEGLNFPVSYARNVMGFSTDSWDFLDIATKVSHNGEQGKEIVFTPETPPNEAKQVTFADRRRTIATLGRSASTPAHSVSVLFTDTSRAAILELKNVVLSTADLISLLESGSSLHTLTVPLENEEQYDTLLEYIGVLRNLKKIKLLMKNPGQAAKRAEEIVRMTHALGMEGLQRIGVNAWEWVCDRQVRGGIRRADDNQTPDSRLLAGGGGTVIARGMAKVIAIKNKLAAAQEEKDAGKGVSGRVLKNGKRVGGKK